MKTRCFLFLYIKIYTLWELLQKAFLYEDKLLFSLNIYEIKKYKNNRNTALLKL